MRRLLRVRDSRRRLVDWTRQLSVHFIETPPLKTSFVNQIARQTSLVEEK